MASDEKVRVAHLASLLGRPVNGDPAASGSGFTLQLGASAGDDCATIDLDGPMTLVCGSDYVRGAGFKLFELGLLNYYDIGWYLVGANLSDVAAMGAVPLGLLTVVRYPDWLSDEDFYAIMTGARDAARAHGCEILGGDTGGASDLVLSASALGVCQRGHALTRKGAATGDHLCLTGEIGRPAAALLYFSRRPQLGSTLPFEVEADLLDSWRRVNPRLRHGRILGGLDLASACQDVSDGLRATTEEFATASGVGLELVSDDLPISLSAILAADLLGVDPVALAVSASVDFELLFSVHPARFDSCREELEAQGLEMLKIGTVVDGTGVTLRRGNTKMPMPGVSWRHQANDIAEVLGDALAKPGEPDQPGETRRP